MQVSEAWKQKLDPLGRMLITLRGKLTKHTSGFATLFRQPNGLLSVFNNEDGQLKADVFIKLKSEHDVDKLGSYGVKRRAQIKKIVIARIPINALPTLAQQNFVQFIQLSGQSRCLNDSGRLDIRAEQVHLGRQLTQAYQGDGVIVGLLDSGIDFTHPDFSNENGTRIHYLLEYIQGGSEIEWTKNQIDATPNSVTQRDGDGSGGHGTHVAGTVAGGGRLNAVMRGMAPQAAIIFVKGIRNPQSRGSIANADIVTGCQYIFQKASAMNKPAVINLSIGTHLGPHDGTSLFEQSLSALIEPGNMIVSAAGNDGHLSIHAGGTITPNVTHETLLLIEPGTAGALLDMWYERDLLSGFAVGAYSVDESGSLSFLGATEEVRAGEFLDVTPLMSGDEVIGYVAIDAQTIAEPNNGDGRAVFLVTNNGKPTIEISDVVWTVMSTGLNKSGRMDMWVVTGGRFYDRKVGLEGVKEIPGNTDYTVVMPSTANEVLAVGAYVTKNMWLSADGNRYNKLDPNPDDPDNRIVPEVGQMAFFSSRGPTRDGRISPNIAAPGEFIFSCLSSHLTPGIGFQIENVLQGGGYHGFQGTSMATPHVTGTIALMLQANPNLTYALVRQFLQETGRTDSFTGSVPNNRFGAGRIDALTAVQKAAASEANSFPVLIHIPPVAGESGMRVTLSAEAGDNDGIDAVHLNYRRGGDRTFTTLPMTIVDASYKSMIPEEAVTTRGIEYTIEATDINGNTTRSPFSGLHTIQVAIGGEGEQKPTVQPADTLQTAYRLISMPLDLQMKSPGNVLEDDLGRQDVKSWRLFELQNGNWNEFPNTADFLPGNAFFLIVNKAGIKIDSGPGMSNDSGHAYSIPIMPGWNLIGDPFNFPVSTSKIKFQKSKARPILRTFNGQWSGVGDVVEILPFEGYAVFNHLSSSDVLLVDPNAPASSAVVAKAQNKMAASQWSIRILAQCQQARDSDNVAAAIPKAVASWDFFDQPEPPVIGQYISVYFPHPGWNMLTDFYSIDARPSPVDGDVWNFEIRTNIHDEVRLTFDGIRKVPREFEVWLVDEDLKLSQNLRKANRFSTAPPPNNQSRRLQLMIGKPDYIQRKIETFKGMPENFELFQNFPNPFNSITTIRYALPQAEKVTLRVFNILGKEVATLANGELQERGFHTAIWKGTDDDGFLVASGIYILRIQSGSFSKAKKMILIK
ncbi:MAG: S8 family serine peptidase [Phycisphaerae bacterium]|nr:S8 family serine peptidase [Phycisphaerae bacterium]